ncbi:MAG TPA: tetratricopeptide repeat protein [Blastocatellia bacterium]|nr:tetratricopeptide repeat protein [Blastocatellia bacterium]
MIPKCAALFLFAVFVTTAFGQNQPSAAAQEANKLWQAQKWEESAKAYEALTKAEPNNGQAWFRLGSSLMSLNRYDAAIAPLEKAAELLRGPLAYYVVGTAYARLNNKDKAFEFLNRANGAGFSQRNRLNNDPLLAGLRDDARFKTILEGVDRNARPCKYSDEAKQLDFWVGEWDVQINGQSVGANVIERLEEGCLIMENWTGNGGGTGKSMNFYNPVTKKWRQTYIGNNQIVWEMSGEYKDGVMQYDGEMLAAGSQPTTVRVKFYNLGPDKLRHTQDNLGGDGKTWTTVWDSIYVRKKAAASETK